MPPPSPCALLFVTVKRVATSDTRPSAAKPPPLSPAKLPETSTSESVICASPSSTMPPPLASAMFAGSGGSGSGNGSASLPETWVSVIVTRLRRPIAFEAPSL